MKENKRSIVETAIIYMNNNFEEHTREKGYIGVTSFISTFFKLFDAERIAFFVAKAQGKTKEEVLKEWEGLEEIGSLIHQEIEEYLLIGISSELNIRSQHAIDYINEKYHSEEFSLYPEVKITSEKFKLRGVIDLLVYNNITKEITIIDWKTNKNINKSRGREVKNATKDIMDKKINKFYLQLLLYKEILKESQLNVNHINIIHLTDNKFSELEPVQNLSSAITEMLKYRNHCLEKLDEMSMLN